MAAKYAAVTVKEVVDEAASELVLSGGKPDGEVKGEIAVLRCCRDVAPVSSRRHSPQYNVTGGVGGGPAFVCVALLFA